MSSEEIDSTTFSHVAEHSENRSELCVGQSVAEISNSTEAASAPNTENGQKRKLTEVGSDENGDGCMSENNKKSKTNAAESIREAVAVAVDNNDNQASVPENDKKSKENVAESVSEAVTAAVGNNANQAVNVTNSHGNDASEIAQNPVIKQEPPDDTEAACSSTSASVATTVAIKTEVKIEPNDEAVKVEADTEEGTKTTAAVKEEATSSVRDSCQYGIRCYRDENVPHSPTQSKKQWTSRDIRKMLKMVEERPVIWQVDYSDRTSRPNAFLEIEKVLGFPALEIKRKLHNMRCTFRNQFKSAVFHNRPVKWKYYDAMKFMYTSALSGDSMDPWEDDVPSKPTITAVNVPWKKRIRDRTHSKSKQIIPETNKRLLQAEPISPIDINSSETVMIACTDQKTVENNLSNLQYQQQRQKDDSNNIFGEYVAESIRNLPDDLRELAKRQITHLLSDLSAHTRDYNTTIMVDDGQCSGVVGSGGGLIIDQGNVVYSVYDLTPQAVLNEPQEIQLKLHEY